MPWVDVKLVPAMVMEAPGRPLDGVSEVMPGATLTVNETPLLACTVGARILIDRCACRSAGARHFETLAAVRRLQYIE